jgi:hypothetical protein
MENNMKVIDFDEHDDIIEEVIGDVGKTIGYTGYAIVELNDEEMGYLSDDDYTLDDFISDSEIDELIGVDWDNITNIEMEDNKLFVDFETIFE